MEEGGSVGGCCMWGRPARAFIRNENMFRPQGDQFSLEIIRPIKCKAGEGLGMRSNCGCLSVCPALAHLSPASNQLIILQGEGLGQEIDIQQHRLTLLTTVNLICCTPQKWAVFFAIRGRTGEGDRETEREIVFIASAASGHDLFG